MVCAAFLSSAGCVLFTQDSARGQIEKLRMVQMVFIDDFTAAPGKEWKEAEFEARVQGDKAQFQQAVASEKTPVRRSLLQSLSGQFDRSATMLRNRAARGKPFYTDVIAAELKRSLKADYDRASQAGRAN